MKVSFIAAFLSAFVAVSNATPGVASEESRLDQLEELVKDMPKQPDSHFLVQGDHLLSVSENGTTLGDKIIDPNEARQAGRKTRRQGDSMVRRATSPSEPQQLFGRTQLCATFYCDEPADCFQYYSVTRSGNRFRCNGCDQGLSKCTL
ncbi:hypothetical protein M426DRAFT_6905 [Hypoxylon sp. CI-4A]|nr:hypothetical protein M426DRAFT_6905 [Hypoxylon sp. CI-4A]